MWARNVTKRQRVYTERGSGWKPKVVQKVKYHRWPEPYTDLVDCEILWSKREETRLSNLVSPSLATVSLIVPAVGEE